MIGCLCICLCIGDEAFLNICLMEFEVFGDYNMASFYTRTEESAGILARAYDHSIGRPPILVWFLQADHIFELHCTRLSTDKKKSTNSKMQSLIYEK